LKSIGTNLLRDRATLAHKLPSKNLDLSNSSDERRRRTVIGIGIGIGIGYESDSSSSSLIRFILYTTSDIISSSSMRLAD